MCVCGSFFDSAVLLNYLSPTYFIVPTTKKRRKGKGGKKVNRSVGGKKRRLGGGGRGEGNGEKGEKTWRGKGKRREGRGGKGE